MKAPMLTYIAALGASFVLAAPAVNAGFDLSDWIKSPLITEAEITPPNGGDAEIDLAGRFCDDPTVYQGMDDGTVMELFVLQDDNSAIKAVLADYQPDVTYKIGVKCWHYFYWRVSSIDVTTPPELQVYYRESVKINLPDGNPVKAFVPCDEGDLAIGGGFDHQFDQSVRVLRSQFSQDEGGVVAPPFSAGSVGLGEGWIVHFQNQGSRIERPRVKVICLKGAKDITTDFEYDPDP